MASKIVKPAQAFKSTAFGGSGKVVKPAAAGKGAANVGRNLGASASRAQIQKSFTPAAPPTPYNAAATQNASPPARTLSQWDPNAHDAMFERDRTNLDTRRRLRASQLASARDQTFAETGQGRNTAAYTRSENVRGVDANSSARGLGRSGIRDLGRARAARMYREASDNLDLRDKGAATAYSQGMDQSEADYRDELDAATTRKFQRWMEGLT